MPRHKQLKYKSSSLRNTQVVWDQMGLMSQCVDAKQMIGRIFGSLNCFGEDVSKTFELFFVV